MKENIGKPSAGAPRARRRIAVMLGGPSAEREVSLKSGRAVGEALRSRGHRVDEIDPKTPSWSLPKDVEVVFLALHGAYGEDGGAQERLDELGVPYTGFGAAASRLAFDKADTKKKWREAGVPTPASREFETPDAPFPADWRLPVALKPVRQGSSFGLRFVRRAADFAGALRDALRFDKRVLMEELIEGRELTVGVLDGQALPIVEIKPKQGIFDYHNKYTKGATDYDCPAPLDAESTERIQELSLLAFDAVGGRDYGRVDLMLDAEGEPRFPAGS